MTELSELSRTLQIVIQAGAYLFLLGVLMVVATLFPQISERTDSRRLLLSGFLLSIASIITVVIVTIIEASPE